MSDRDYYEILGLTPRADGTMVDQSYWHLARKYQALAVTNARARSMLDELNEAYGVLGTSRLRQQYDAFRDDVLIRKGMLQPVASKPRHTRSTTTQNAGDSSARFGRLPRIRTDSWRTYATGGIIMALALAAAWQGVNVLFVISAIIGGLALTLTPVLRRRVSDLNLSLPAVAMPSLPEIRAPQVTMPKLAELNIPSLRDIAPIPSRDEGPAPDELHASTAALIGRWRTSVGLRPLAPEATPAGEPSSELVEIVESERTLENNDEPLAAVIDILRGSRRQVETSQ